jgi:hypothetical protein
MTKLHVKRRITGFTALVLAAAAITAAVEIGAQPADARTGAGRLCTVTNERGYPDAVPPILPPPCSALAAVNREAVPAAPVDPAVPSRRCRREPRPRSRSRSPSSRSACTRKRDRAELVVQPPVTNLRTAANPRGMAITGPKPAPTINDRQATFLGTGANPRGTSIMASIKPIQPTVNDLAASPGGSVYKAAVINVFNQQNPTQKQAVIARTFAAAPGERLRSYPSQAFEGQEFCFDPPANARYSMAEMNAYASEHK